MSANYKNLICRGLRRLFTDGPRVFFYKTRSYFEPKVDSISKNNFLIGIFLVPFFGLLYSNLIFRVRSGYLRVTIRKNVFGRRFYWFPDFRYRNKIHEKEKYLYRYFEGHDTVKIEPTDTVFEVGAARGITTQIAAEMGHEVVAIEASPRVFTCLEKTLVRDNVYLLNVGAWNEPGEMEIEYGRKSGDDTFLTPDHGAIGESEMVRIDTIENLAEEMGYNKIDFMKVEAEGAEPEVIEGIGGLHIKKVVVNCSEERDGESTKDEVCDILKSKGYEIIDCKDKIVFATKSN